MNVVYAKEAASVLRLNMYR